MGGIEGEAEETKGRGGVESLPEVYAHMDIYTTCYGVITARKVD